MPHETTLRKATSMPVESFWQDASTAGVTTEDENFFDALDALPARENNSRKEGLGKRGRRPEHQLDTNATSADEKSLLGAHIGGGEMASDGGKDLGKQKVARRIPRKPLGASEAGIPADEKAQFRVKHRTMEVSDNVPGRESSLRFRRSATAMGSFASLRGTDKSLAEVADENVTKSLELVDSLDETSLANTNSGGNESSSQGFDMDPESSEMLSKQSTSELSGVTLPSERAERMEAPGTNLRDPMTFERVEPSNESPLPSPSSGAQARDRWRRAKTKLAFVHHLSEGHRRGVSGDFLDDGGEDLTDPEYESVAGKVDDPEVEGGESKKEALENSGRGRSRGRKGQDGMVVRQDKGMIALVQDFYVACLKLPITHFLIGVFLAPIALGLLFTPIYLMDREGLSFNEDTASADEIILGRAAIAKENMYHLLDVFLYALSLSTTFGGSPVAALSPFSLCIANVNTLMGQFLFVFLSGAVFARMSQPSQPIRCSKKAVIRADDLTPLNSQEVQDKPKVFAVRLVLTGPPPCELVDAKICVTFRILIRLPSGSIFSSTQDLTLVRPEVSYLRYGILVRHVIDNKSPIYGHTMESLMEGDASFSLTIMGLERASMQPIFHLEDYYVCDGDVAWDADYIDFVHIDKAGNRVLDHSKLDLIKVTEETKMAGKWSEQRESSSDDDQGSIKGVKAGLCNWKSRSAAWKSKSNSFTRADR